MRKSWRDCSILKISEVLDKYPYQVSGGPKTRVAIARAIITKPDTSCR